MDEVVWLTEERTLAVLVTLGAYMSKVKYTRAGVDYEIFIDNDEFEYFKENTGDDTEN